MEEVISIRGNPQRAFAYRQRGGELPVVGWVPSQRQKLHINTIARFKRIIHDSQVFSLCQVLFSNPKECPRAYMSRYCLSSEHPANGSTTHIHHLIATASTPSANAGIQYTSHAITADALALPISI
jgi:hypothetical protein